MQAVDEPSTGPNRSERFIFGLLWNWAGVAAGLFTGLLISPYLIRKLGDEAYGLWTLSFAVVEYGSFLDLGFRSAIVKYIAHYHALEDSRAINHVLNTGVIYAGAVSGAIFTLTVLLSGYVQYFLNISPSYQAIFRTLLILVSLSWCLTFVFSLFGACLEAIQRFDLYNKVTATCLVMRAAGIAVLLYSGHGLIAIGVWTVCTQGLGYVLYLILFRRAVPSFRLSPKYANLATLRMMASFGIHTFIVNVSSLFLNQGPPMLIGHFLPAKFITYYQWPMKLIQYTGEAVARIGVITNASAAEMHARGNARPLLQLAIYSNRYALMLFMPVAIVLWIFGKALFNIFVPSITKFGAPLLPILLTGFMIAVVAQFNSGMLLQGLGRHQRFARGLLLESIAAVISLCYVLPRYGILGAAWAVCVCMVLNRGLFAPWLVSREMNVSFLWFMHSVYTWPVLTGVPVAVFAYLLRQTILPGRNVFQLVAAGALVAIPYFAIAFFACLPAMHRARVTSLIKRNLPMRYNFSLAGGRR